VNNSAVDREKTTTKAGGFEESPKRLFA